MPAAPNVPALPPPIAAPISTETRLAYVLRHFWLVHEPLPNVSIGYADTQPTVTIADAAGPFFQQNTPFPAAPNFREWAGRRVPFFFDTQPLAPLLVLGAGQAVINADIISAAFYLLSGWQEYFSDTRDRHGRFPFDASVQKQYGFVALPVVNCYFDVLKMAIEHVTGRPLSIRPWRQGAPFAAFISHDIDNLRSAWKAPAKAALKQGQLLKFGQQLWRHLTQPDAWDNLETVAAATAEYDGARSTFFILPEHRPGADGTPNADYSLSAGFVQRLETLKTQGCALGLHGSIGTATDALHLTRNLDDAGYAARGLRFHYLRWEPRQTPGVVDSVGFEYDSTLGFAEHYGFRHSYCHPFYPFNFSTATEHGFLEIPLVVMDATLHHPHYLRLAPAEVLPALRPVLDEIARFGGVFSLLWHNENFDPANTRNGPAQFHELMGELRGRGATFLTGREILALLPS
ncbi:DUF7033 domain-containing protein [Hymenobacter terricola]|uniref:DUF7033 domain-containing protein n=1 Tax=Hymenobacter terricola TaxID=2819236 RepID=UPI001B303277|nr:hypothetical protein [Hymenobacter terricola]